MKSLLTLNSISSADLQALVTRSVEFGSHERCLDKPLKDRAVGIYFSVPSTRTRTAFWRAAVNLGGSVISYAPAELQISTGETLSDTGRILSTYLDCLVVRTNGAVEDMALLRSDGRLGVVNALSADEHPTQALADLGVLHEKFGSLNGIHIVYIGEGNSTANALAIAAQRCEGCRLSIVTPAGYGLPDSVMQSILTSDSNSNRISFPSRPEEVRLPVDVIYTSRWRTMGVEKSTSDWTAAFKGYRVSRDLLDLLGARSALIMHDLPAVRGEDIESAILDGPQSIAWRQAHYKLFSAMATLEWIVS